ncbi:hypothetical protein CC2G_004322 [Coprinopsis cinerea AmutBmut pab1-1]|nr:hypothetical protein CC2G_004322 [Coprinopsis cinerea AmutBmut pab1-1]
MQPASDRSRQTGRVLKPLPGQWKPLGPLIPKRPAYCDDEEVTYAIYAGYEVPEEYFIKIAREMAPFKAYLATTGFPDPMITVAYNAWRSCLSDKEKRKVPLVRPTWRTSARDRPTHMIFPVRILDSLLNDSPPGMKADNPSHPSKGRYLAPLEEDPARLEKILRVLRKYGVQDIDASKFTWAWWEGQRKL